MHFSHSAGRGTRRLVVRAVALALTCGAALLQTGQAQADSDNPVQQLIRSKRPAATVAPAPMPMPEPVVVAPPVAAPAPVTPPVLATPEAPRAVPAPPADARPFVPNAEVAALSAAGTPMIAPGSAGQLRAAEARYAAIAAQGGWPKLGRGTYKKGSKGKHVVALNRRLAMEGYLSAGGMDSAVFTPATAQALTRYQANMGLGETGKVDGPTLASLNVPVSQRLATIRANIERLAAYEQNLGGRYVIVNVPAQQIQTVSNGHINSVHRAIVGKPERPTPVVMTALSDINFNPYWNAPASIVEKDIIPKINNGGTDILRSMNIRVFKGYGGEEIDPDTVDWKTAVADDYLFRQEPGGGNAMATAKINFTSPFGIYLHDTPERYAFNNAGRFYSSGCVRVDKVSVLLNWILNGQDGINAGRISELAKSQERLDVKLATPPQLRVAYLTAWPAGGGTVAFRNDIYEMDGSGFTVGQPMPVGEQSPEGQRYVLKPIPRQPASVDAAEAEGFGLFGGLSKSKTADKTKTAPPPVTATSKPLLKPAVADAPAKGDLPEKTAKATVTDKTKATVAAKPKAGDKNFPGLFDWEKYRKEQAAAAKAKPADKKVVKKTAADKKVADKKTVEKKVTDKTRKVAETTPPAKPVKKKPIIPPKTP